MCMKDLAPTPKKSYSIVGEGKLPSHQPPSLITCGGEENWPWGHENRRSSPDPHWLQHSEEQALHFTQAKLESWRWTCPQDVKAAELTTLPLTQLVVSWVRERFPLCPTQPAPFHLWQAGMLALRGRAHQSWRAGPAGHQLQHLEEWALHFAWAKQQTWPQWFESSATAQGMRVGELTTPLAACCQG